MRRPRSHPTHPPTHPRSRSVLPAGFGMQNPAGAPLHHRDLPHRALGGGWERQAAAGEAIEEADLLHGADRQRTAQPEGVHLLAHGPVAVVEAVHRLAHPGQADAPRQFLVDRHVRHHHRLPQPHVLLPGGAEGGRIAAVGQHRVHAGHGSHREADQAVGDLEGGGRRETGEGPGLIGAHQHAARLQQHEGAPHIRPLEQARQPGLLLPARARRQGQRCRPGGQAGCYCRHGRQGDGQAQGDPQGACPPANAPGGGTRSVAAADHGRGASGQGGGEGLTPDCPHRSPRGWARRPGSPRRWRPPPRSGGGGRRWWPRRCGG